MNPMMQEKQGVPPGAQAMPENSQPVDDQMAQGEGQPEVPDIDPQDMAMVLFSRIDQLSQPEQVLFAQIVTPQTAPLFYKLFPELGPLLDQIIQHKQGGAGMPPAGGAQPMPQQGGAPMPQQGQPHQMAEEADENPLLSRGISKGLMG